jgi:HlyD family secretion protein
MPAAPLLRGRRTRWALALAAILAAALAVRAWRGPAVPAYATARGTLVERVVASGQVMPPARVSLAALQLAPVAEVRVREGDRVARGDLLVRLDDAEARAQVAQARAQLVQAQARLEQVRGTGARVAGEGLRQAEVRVGQAEARLRRVEAQAAGGAATEQDLDDARRALELARSQAESAAAQAIATSQAGADFRVAAAVLAQARAQLALAEARLGQTRLVAPAAGLVLVRGCEPGDVVAAGKPLVVLSADGETRLSVQPDEKNLALLRVGQRASAVADAFPGEPFDAEVSYIAPSVDPARGTVEVRLRVPRPPAILRADMTVSVNVEVSRREGAVWIPADAVRGDGGEAWVLVVGGGRAERRPVRTGLRGQGVVEVRSGLAEGEAVAPVTAPVRPGDRARPLLLPAPAEAARAL